MDKARAESEKRGFMVWRFCTFLQHVSAAKFAYKVPMEDSEKAILGFIEEMKKKEKERLDAKTTLSLTDWDEMANELGANIVCPEITDKQSSS